MRIRRTLLLLSACLTATLTLAGVLRLTVAPDAEAEEGPRAERAQLLLKCPVDQVTPVRKALRGLDVEVYDLESMRRLPPYLAPQDVPRLPDAVGLMREILATVGRLKAQDGTPLLRVTEMVVQERRATFKVATAERAAFDRVRSALAENDHLRARKVRVEAGAMTLFPADGRAQQSFSLRLSDAAAPGRARGAGAATTDIPMQFMQASALATRMRNVYASATQDDPNPQRGYRTVAREFTYDPATLRQFETLVGDLSKSDVYTVYELRWKLAPAKEQTEPAADRIGKSVIKVGTRAPLED